MVYPESLHVRQVGLESSDDLDIRKGPRLNNCLQGLGLQADELCLWTSAKGRLDTERQLLHFGD